MTNHSKSTVLAVGPPLNPITGQSISFHHVKKIEGLRIKVTETAGASLWGNVKFIISLIQSIVIDKPDVIYTTYSRSRRGLIRDLIVSILARTFKIPIVNHVHGAEILSFLNKQGAINKRLFINIYRLAKVHILLHTSMLEQLSFIKREKIKILSNATSYNYNNWYYEGRENKFLYMSNWIPSKGLKALICGFNLARIRNPDLELHVCGARGYDKIFDAEMQSLIEGSDNVYDVGAVSDDKKDELFRKCGSSVLLSSYPTEAQPISIIEAIMNNQTVLFLKHNYLEEIFTQKKVFTIENTDPETVSKSLLSMMKENRGDTSYEPKDYEQYRLEFYVSKLERIIRDVVDEYK